MVTVASLPPQLQGLSAGPTRAKHHETFVRHSQRLNRSKRHRNFQNVQKIGEASRNLRIDMSRIHTLCNRNNLAQWQRKQPCRPEFWTGSFETSRAVIRVPSTARSAFWTGSFETHETFAKNVRFGVRSIRNVTKRSRQHKV